MLGSSAAVQLAALPTELDASFKRALPMLKDGYLRSDQLAAAHRILNACSLTYVAASFAGVLHIWPWLGRGRAFLVAGAERAPTANATAPAAATGKWHAAAGRPAGLRGGAFEDSLRRLAKPFVRRLLAS